MVTSGRKVEIYRLLIDHGWDLSVTDYHGKTALHHLASGNDLQPLKFLVENGGDLTQQDDKG